MALTIKLGDRFGVHEPYGDKKEKIYEIIAFRQNPKKKSEWQIQIRNVRGTKKSWVHANFLYSPVVRHIKSHEK